jgi:hypothetical protein
MAAAAAEQGLVLLLQVSVFFMLVVAVEQYIAMAVILR